MVVVGHPFYTMYLSQGHDVAGDADRVVALKTPQRGCL
jgi:hypothetical protein